LFALFSISYVKQRASRGKMKVFGKKLAKFDRPWVSYILVILSARKSLRVNSIDLGN